MIAETHLKAMPQTRGFVEHVSLFYVTNWRRRLLFFAITLLITVVYGLVMSMALNRAMERVAVEMVGLTFLLMVAWPTYVTLRHRKPRQEGLVADEKRISQSFPVFSASRDFATRLQEKARLGRNSAAINAWLIKTKAAGKCDIDALCKILTQFVQGVESSTADEARWRPTLLPIITRVEEAFGNRSKAYATMVSLADRDNWSAWAVRCLPSLYNEIERVEGEVTAYVSRYVLASTPRSYRTVVSLCGGEILKVQMDSHTANEIESTANLFCNYLRHEPSESDRAFLGTIVTLLSYDEIASRGTKEAEKLKTQRMKILEDENVMLAA